MKSLQHVMQRSFLLFFFENQERACTAEEVNSSVSSVLYPVGFPSMCLVSYNKFRSWSSYFDKRQQGSWHVFPDLSATWVTADVYTAHIIYWRGQDFQEMMDMDVWQCGTNGRPDQATSNFWSPFSMITRWLGYQ